MIPRNLAHVWIGPSPAPVEWMNTWPEKNPDWAYHIYDNDFLKNFDFACRPQIEYLYKKGTFAGAADIMRYEILHRFGGVIVEADSICLKPIAPIFGRDAAYTVYENEFIRGELVSPIMACEPGNQFVAALIEEIRRYKPSEIGAPWKYTGNLFLANMIKKHNPDIVIFPSYYFNPVHYTGVVSNQKDEAFAMQLWGTTKNAYQKPGLLARLKQRYYKRRAKLQRSLDKRRGKSGRKSITVEHDR